MLAPLPCCRIVLACLALLAGESAARAQESEPRIVGAEIGFQGAYKLGCWTPVWVELLGGTEAWTGRVVVTVPDTDGVPTRVISERSRPVGIDPGQTTRVGLFVRVGQSNSSLLVQFFSDDGKLRAKRKFFAGSEASERVVPGGLPATNRLLLEFGGSLGLGGLLQTDNRAGDLLATRVVRVDEARGLPTEWYGYESIDTVLLSTSEPELYRPLLQSRGRIEALEAWVERGGRLIVFCGVGAEELLGKEGALVSLVPGTYEKMERLTQAQPLETFSGSEQPITRDRRLDLQMPRLMDVKGQVLASAGRGAAQVPLVVRSSRGLGQVVFVGMDFDRPPLRDWGGRDSFLRRLLDWQDEDDLQANHQTDMEDVSSHLRNSLDKKFVGVQVAPFGLVALLVGIYIVLIGPGDYFFVKRILRRTELTWVTFPLIVLGVSAAAYGIANRMKGDQLRVNQVEIVDVDGQSGLVCGTVWTHFFTPRVSEFDLRLEPRFLGQTELDENEQLVSWLGLPGYALGGMQASGSQTSVLDGGYQYGEGLASLERLPVQVWSTKTLAARWSARVEMPLSVVLRQDGEELLGGKITNESEIELEDCLLLYGRWAYDLGRLKGGDSRDIDESLQPKTVKTLLTSATAGDKTVTRMANDGTVSFQNAASWDIARLLKATMFYTAVNGRQYMGKAHRYQSFVDLSHVLQQEGRAILLAKCRAPGSQWMAGEEALASGKNPNDKDRRWTYYRFVLKVDDRKKEPQINADERR